MANEIVNSTITSDQEKFLASTLIARAQIRVVCASVCDEIQQPKGTGLTAYFVRYNRMNVPLTTLTEATDPSNSNFDLTQVSVTLDQWGAYIILSDVAQLTAKHPLLQQAMELLSENAARVLDREIQIVWLAGTNVQYGDGSVTSRATVTAAMKISDTVIHKAVANLVNGGAPPRGGPSGGIAVEKASALGGSNMINGNRSYVGITTPEVMRDIMQSSTSLGTFASVQMYNNARALYMAEVGTWLGVRWVESNFLPKFRILGNTTTAVASGAAFGTDTPTVTVSNGAGSLSNLTTYYYKVSRKDKLRGFEEFISIEHTTATGAADDTFDFSFAGLTAGYVYNLYFGSATGDSNLKLHTANIAVGDTVTVLSVPASTTTAPANVNTTGTPTIHPVYIHGEASCNLVSLQNLEMILSDDKATTSNPLKLRRTVGYKFLAKAMIRDNARMIRCEVASSF